MTATGSPQGTVRVLLSTWNSERHLEAQLASVLGQDYPSLELVVRDDGSRDGTRELLAAWAARHPGRMRYWCGENVGVVASFFALLRECGPGADFVAFCDHDDVWHDDKLRAAVGALEPLGPEPALYAGRLRYVDDSGAPAGLSRAPGRPLTLGNALVENVATGCTVVMNAAARDLVLRTEELSGVRWHDWWCYLVVSALGRVVFDPVPRIDYRLHASNQVGAASGWSRVRKYWRVLAGGTLVDEMLAQAEAFRRTYGAALAAPSRAVLDAFLDRPASRTGRLLYALTVPTRRQRMLDEVVLRTSMAIAGRPLARRR